MSKQYFIFNFLLILILISMETWGSLPKSQTQAQTIEEMVDAKIAAHEASPTSHTGENESLAVHRENEMIDHKQGSIPADKFSQKEYFFSTNFDAYPNWTTVGEVVNYQWPGISLYIESGAVAESKLLTTPFFNPTLYDLSKEFLFQTSLQIEPASNYKMMFGLITGENYDSPDGTGFQFINGVVKAFIGQISGGTALVISSAIGIDPSDTHIYRIHNVPDEGVVRFYVDGELVAELIPTNASDSDEVDIKFYFKTNGTVDGYTHIHNLDLARKQ